VKLASLTEDQQRSATDHELRSDDDARSLLDTFEQSLEPVPSPSGGGDQNGGGGQDNTGQNAKQGNRKASGGGQQDEKNN
jgi:hypothetical protein